MVELDSKGFRIELAEEFPIESLPDLLEQDIRETYSKSDCTVIFRVKDAKTGKGHLSVIPFGMGDDSSLAALQEFADGLKKDDIIKELNMETLNVTNILSNLYRIKA
jgi:hypothetical protein